MISAILLPLVAWAGDPPAGIAGDWQLRRVEGGAESWDYAAKAAEWARYTKGRCHEIERRLSLRGDEVELVYRWQCEELGLGSYVSERSIVAAAQWSGADLTVPMAEGVGTFIALKPPNLTTGRRAVAILPAEEKGSQLGPFTWRAELIPAPPRAKEPALLRLSRESGETWILEPVVVAVPL